MPVVFKTHEQTHPFFVDLLWRRVWLLSAPLIYLLLCYSLGLLQAPFGHILIDGAGYRTLEAPDSWRPSPRNSNKHGSQCSVSVAYILSASAPLLYLNPEPSLNAPSRGFACLLAVLTCIYGFIQQSIGIDRALFTPGTGQNDFFAYFPYDGHWAAFALLWCYACMAMALLQNRHEGSDTSPNRPVHGI